MSPSPKSGGKGASRSERVPRSRPRLNPVMACDSSFRVVARRCLADLAANHAATCTGDAEALHQMRVALARLRATISFFSPMVADSQRKQIRAELKWLHGQLGAVRDLDVAIGRLETSGKRRPYDYRSWKAKRAQSHRHLARALRSASYRRLIEHVSGWIESGPWSTGEDKACRQKAGLPDRGIQRPQIDAMAGKIAEEEPKTPEYDCEKAASAAPVHQEMLLFDRIFQRPVPKQGAVPATGRGEAFASSAKSARAVERRCKRPISCSRPATRRRSRLPAISRQEA